MIEFSATAWTAILAADTAAGRAQALATLNPTTIEFLDAADTVIRTVTTGSWTVSGANAVPGTYTDAGTGGGTPAVAVFKASGTEVMRMSCGTLAGSDYLLLANIVASVKIRRGSFAVTFLDPPGAGTSEPAATVAPVISGTAQVGQTLTATAGTWTGNPVATITRQWYRGASAISGATGAFYTLVSADAGAIISLVETGTNSVGSATSTSNTLGPVADGALDASAVPSPINLDIGGTFDFTPYISGGVPPYTVAVASGSSLPAEVTLTNNVLTATGSAIVDLSDDIVFDVDDSAVAATLPTFGVLSSVGGADLPFTFGHVFKQGDVPAGSYVTADIQTFQCEPRNYWADGSLKFAVLSGRTSMTQNVKKTITLSVTTTAPSGTNVASVTTSDVGTCTVTVGSNTASLADAINGADLSSFTGTVNVRPANAGKLRSIPGPVMTEEHFYAPIPNLPHMSAFWYVRKYMDGRIWIRTAVTHGWARLVNPAEVQATQTVVVNGSTVYSGALNHRARSRWSRVDWIGGDPGLSPMPDTQYLRDSLMVPNYADVAPLEATLEALVQTAAPLTRGPFDQNAASGGQHKHIGLLPYHDALFITSGADARAYRAVMVGMEASNCVGNAGFVWFDETTLRPARIPDFYNDSLSNAYSPNSGTGYVYLSINSSAAPWTTDAAHGWAAGYLAYLLTGDWYVLETAQMHCTAEYLWWGIASGDENQRWTTGYDTRQAAWMMRSMACALAITPETVADQAAIKAGLVSYMQIGWNRWATRELDGNAMGVRAYPSPRTGYESSSTVPYTQCSFQDYFLTQAFAFGYQIAAHLLSETAEGQWLDAVEHHIKLPKGAVSTDYGYRYAGRYSFPVGPDRLTASVPAEFYTTWAEVKAAGNAVWVERGSNAGDYGVGAIPTGESASEGLSILVREDNYYGGSTEAFFAALSYAVDFDATVAAGWNRYTGSSTWPSMLADMKEVPVFLIYPRSI